MENHGKFRCDISFDSFNFDQVFLAKSYQLTIIFVSNIQMNTLYAFNKSKTITSFVGRFS